MGALAALAIGAAMLAGRGARPHGASKPVIVEVFTAQGCSGCPAGEQAIDDLIRNPVVSNAEMIVLAEHVPYWDHIGWTDTFAQPEFKTRQSDYLSKVFRNGGLYTPQAIVDGQWEGSGASAEAVRRAVADAVSAPKATMTVDPLWIEGAGAVRVQMHVELPPELVLKESADVLLAITEDRLTTQITDGDNKGKTVQQNAVARFLKVVGSLDAGSRTWSTTATVPVAGGWKHTDLRAIGMLQERASRRMIGGAAARMTPGSTSQN
jgi:hypothetical protein